MTVRECVAGGPVTSEHKVQLFDSDESRVECAAAFLAEGYQLGEPLVVIARPANWTAIVERLEARQIPVEQLIDEGMLVVRDANDLLRRLTRNGLPDTVAFEALISNPVRELARRGRVRAYGEMVDLLAQRLELTEAIKLEACWNELGARTSMSLMCGYCAAHFVATNTHRALRQICRSHSDVERNSQDPLATWLLDSAHALARAESPSRN
jgi:DcmR-like sensory protein